ncbi:MAG: type II secretion system protein N [Burkholderiales bacterium]|jgi:hypothetical protein|nr:type II secretion system protein N [Burkholderiales bacterium]
MPSWILGNVISEYSNHRLQLFNTHGDFWHGSGLLVVYNDKLDKSSPLVLLHWKIKPGLKKFVEANFYVGENPIADLYLDKRGVNLDKVNVSLSISQLNQLSDIIKDFGVSGNINVITQHLLLNKQVTGQIDIKLEHISSGVSKINPLGTYNLSLDAATGNINVNSTPDSILNLSGSGNPAGLILNGTIQPQYREDMAQFVTLLGVPTPNGSYQIKVF